MGIHWADLKSLFRVRQELVRHIKNVKKGCYVYDDVQLIKNYMSMCLPSFCLSARIFKWKCVYVSDFYKDLKGIMTGRVSCRKERQKLALHSDSDLCAKPLQCYLQILRGYRT